MKKTYRTSLAIALAILMALSLVANADVPLDEHSLDESAPVTKVVADPAKDAFAALYEGIMEDVFSLVTEENMRQVHKTEDGEPIYPDDFGGIYQDGDHFVMNIVENNDQNAPIFPQQSATRRIAEERGVAVQTVKYSLNDLNEASREIIGRARNDGSTNVIYVARDDKNNKLEVGVSSTDESAIKEVTAQFSGDEGMLVFVMADEIVDDVEALTEQEAQNFVSAEADRAADSIYIYAPGDKIITRVTHYTNPISYSYYGSSFGYGLYTNRFGAFGFMMSGHTTKSDNFVYQKANSSADIVGTIRAENNTYIGGDWALATFNNATTTQYGGFYSAWVGQYVTAYGYTSGQRGGTVLKLNVNFTTGPSCMVQATYTSAGGDSGGGVFYSNSPVGLNRGHGTSGGVAVAYFTPASQYMGSSVY